MGQIFRINSVLTFVYHYFIVLVSIIFALQFTFTRKSSGKRRQNKSPSPAPVPEAPCISIEEVDKETTEEEPAHIDVTDNISEEGYQSDSDSSTDEFEDEYPSTRKLYVEGIPVVKLA